VTFMLQLCYERRLRRTGSRYFEPEPAPASGCALDPDTAAVKLDRVFHDRKPEPGPSRSARSTVIDAIKPLEDSSDMLGLDAPARVGDREQDLVPCAPEGDLDASGVRVLDRVVEKVPQRDLDPSAIQAGVELAGRLELQFEPRLEATSSKPEASSRTTRPGSNP